MDTPQKLSKAMKWVIEVLNEGGDLNSLLPEERSPSPRHIPARDRCRSPLQRPLNQMKPRHEEQCQRDICQFSHAKFQALEETMKETVRQQMAQLMNIEKAGYVEPCQAQPTSYQSVRSAQVTTRAVHDLQVIKCDSRILSAIDEFWDKCQMHWQGQLGRHFQPPTAHFHSLGFAPTLGSYGHQSLSQRGARCLITMGYGWKAERATLHQCVYEGFDQDYGSAPMSAGQSSGQKAAGQPSHLTRCAGPFLFSEAQFPSRQLLKVEGVTH